MIMIWHERCLRKTFILHPGHVALPLHHEKPRFPKPPNHIYFCCVTPAEQGGGTLFANAEAIWLDMPQQIQKKLLIWALYTDNFIMVKQLGIIY